MAKKKRVKPSTSKVSAAQRLKLFIDTLLANGENATQAAITAGYSAKSAYSQGSRLLRDVKVQAALEVRRKQVADKFQLTTENVARSCAQALFFDARRLYNADGSLKSIVDLDDDTIAALASVEVVEMQGGMKVGGEDGASHVPLYTKKVKWLDKNAAREQAMKYLGMFEKDNKQKTDPVRDLLAAIDGRSAKLTINRKPVG